MTEQRELSLADMVAILSILFSSSVIAFVIVALCIGTAVSYPVFSASMIGLCGLVWVIKRIYLYPIDPLKC